jgi:hypothetical protein
VGIIIRVDIFFILGKLRKHTIHEVVDPELALYIRKLCKCMSQDDIVVIDIATLSHALHTYHENFVTEQIRAIGVSFKRLKNIVVWVSASTFTCLSAVSAFGIKLAAGILVVLSVYYNTSYEDGLLKKAIVYGPDQNIVKVSGNLAPVLVCSEPSECKIYPFVEDLKNVYVKKDDNRIIKMPSKSTSISNQKEIYNKMTKEQKFKKRVKYFHEIKQDLSVKDAEDAIGTEQYVKEQIRIRVK